MGAQHFLPPMEGLLVLLLEHLFEFILVQSLVLVFEQDELFIEASGLLPFLLLHSGIAEAQQANREYIFRQVEQLAMNLVVFHDVADVTGTKTQRFGCDDGCLGGD
jgi:hypothetical protein